jgi:hypothetical protein
VKDGNLEQKRRDADKEETANIIKKSPERNHGRGFLIFGKLVRT